MAVVVDVSGSIEQEQLDAFTAEVSAVLEEFDTALTLVTCDISLTSCARLTRQDLPLALAAGGGGGTDFRPPFAMLEREGAAPACLVYFTDLQCAAFPDEPPYPVMWVTDRKPQTPPPFGEVVIMED
jgi:predicted metal-dependent peptidase